MELLPIRRTLEENPEFANDPACKDSIQATVEFYKKVGFRPPWIGYYVKNGNQLVGAAAFKGSPVDNKVEIAYNTFEEFQNKGIGREICALLVKRSLETDPEVVITARTMPEENFSTRILRKNNFKKLGVVYDPDDGEVWEWRFVGKKKK